MKLEDFDYDLPKEYIAQEPLRHRHDSKLMVLHGETIEHKRFHDLLDYLEKDDVLVINESKVIPARLVGHKETGGQVEAVITRKLGLLHEAIIKGRVNQGDDLIFDDLRAKVQAKKGGIAKLKFEPELTDEKLHEMGDMPVPPYVRKRLKDQDRYQTVYAEKKGSVAAHTAGLHFTEELLRKIEEKGVRMARVCLHISFGAFFPVRGPIYDHKTDPEFCSISRKNADIINRRKGRLFAVGTTVVKALESLSDRQGIIQPRETYSDLFIYPQYSFKTRIDCLITNFHLPRSTLLLLVCAYFERERILHAYEVAKQNNYRFYSFGDAMLLLNPTQP
jgi:S-adenosylmethionine:tRNA ribosyltransferase-isomerase